MRQFIFRNIKESFHDQVEEILEQLKLLVRTQILDPSAQLDQDLLHLVDPESFFDFILVFKCAAPYFDPGQIDNQQFKLAVVIVVSA